MTEENEQHTNETEEQIQRQGLNDGKHLVKKKRRERIVRKGRMKQERFRAFVRFFLTVGMLLGLIYALKLGGWYMNADAFNKADGASVQIINNKIVPSAKIMTLLKNSDVPNVPLYMAKTSSIKKELLQLKPIENVYIRRYAFPARIQIIVRERIPVIMISPDEKLVPVAFFTTDGTLIGHEYLPFKAQYVETYSKEQVEYVDFRNPNDVYVKIKTVNIRLGKLDDEVYKRIERIPSILPQVKPVEKKVKYLDLSWDKVNYLKLK